MKTGSVFEYRSRGFIYPGSLKRNGSGAGCLLVLIVVGVLVFIFLSAPSSDPSEKEESSASVTSQTASSEAAAVDAKAPLSSAGADQPRVTLAPGEEMRLSEKKSVTPPI